MREEDSGTGRLRPERLGDSLRLRPERLGLDILHGAPASAHPGWALEGEGTTMGRLFRFDSPAEMREFVADLQGVLGTLADRRTPAGREGAVTLMVFLAGHRIGRGDG